MKGKRLVATMLALLLVVSLLPMAALAEDNGTDGKEISGDIVTNTGINVTVTETGSIQTNEGTVSTNNGKIEKNNHTVVNNVKAGDDYSASYIKPDSGYIDTNKGTVTNNGVAPGEGVPKGNYSGYVKDNQGTIENNYGTVNTNNNTVGTNACHVDNNNQTVTTNRGTIYKNGSNQNTTAKVETNAKGGQVDFNFAEITTNDGTVRNNQSAGEIETNNGTVVTNHGTVVNNNAGATVENNKVNATVKENYGFVGKKDGNGNLIVGGSSGNSGNSGTVENNNAGGTVNNISGTVVNNNADGRVYNISGTVVNNNASGIVNNNGGTVQNNNAGGVVNNYGGTVVNNNAYGTVNHNGGTVENNSGDVSNEGGTVEKNEFGGNVVLNIGGTVENNAYGGIVGNNLGLVGKKDENGNLITDGSSGNFGNVQNNMKGGTVVNNGGGTVVSNNAGGIVENNGGTVVSNSGVVCNNTAGSVVKVNEVDGVVTNYSSGPEATTGPKVETNFGTVKYRDPGNGYTYTYYGIHYEVDGKNVYIDQSRNLDTVIFSGLNISRPGYKLVNCQAVEIFDNGFVDVTNNGGYTRKNDDGSVQSFELRAPIRLKLLWEKIVTAVAPAASNAPEAKPVKAAALPSTVAAEDVKVGTVVRVKGQLFRVIEMDDGSMTVVTMGKLSKKDMEDLMAFLAKYFTPEQIELLLGDPELISGALAEELFGGNTGHIVFKAARNLFA